LCSDYAAGWMIWGFESQQRQEILSKVFQTNPGAHPASSSVIPWALSMSKVFGVWGWPLTSI